MRASRPLSLFCAMGLVLVGIAHAGSENDTLSGCFLVKHVGSFLGRRFQLQTRTPDGQWKAIGTVSDPGFDLRALGVGSGAAEQLARKGTQTEFAVSSDGQSIVFASRFETGKGAERVEPGIHRYVCGVGDTLLHPERQCRGFGDILSLEGLPPDVMLFGLVDPALNPHAATFAVGADGHEAPLVIFDAPALHVAAYHGRLASIDSLLGLRADPLAANVLGMTAAEVALGFAHEEAAMRLIEAAPRDTATLEELLAIAIGYGRWKTVGALVERGADLNRPIARKSGAGAPVMPLVIALEGRRSPALDRFVFVSGSSERPRSAEGTLEGVRFLLEHGADPNQRDTSGLTAFHRIASAAQPVATNAIAVNLSVARTLLERGADATLTSSKGNTPLHTLVGTHSDLDYTSSGMAAEWGRDPYSRLLELYVAQTKDLEARNVAGLTPLQRAIGAMNFLAARYLVAHGASDEVDYNGHRVREILADELKSHKRSFWDKLQAASVNAGPSRSAKFRASFPQRYGPPPQRTDGE